MQPLGSGGYADVFLYEQQSPRMPVAVKVLKSEGLTDALRQQFVEEADTMAALGDHPYIVQVFRAGTSDDGRPYLVMKYYPPPNLAMRARAERFSVEEVLRTGIQLASAVETAHRAHITHRDIKPANVLVSAYGAPGLTDFGIAGRGARDGETPPEATDDVGVSVPWAPPEVLYGQSNGDERSDVYSLAATLWQLLVGRSPFEVPGGDNSAYALMPRIRSTPPPPTGRPDVPAGLERLLAQAMAKDPARRPATALELARALQAVEQHQRLARTPIVVLDEQGHTTLVSQTQGSPTGPRGRRRPHPGQGPADRASRSRPRPPSHRRRGPPTDVDDATRRRGSEPAGRHSPSPMPSPQVGPAGAPSGDAGDAAFGPLAGHDRADDEPHDARSAHAGTTTPTGRPCDERPRSRCGRRHRDRHSAASCRGPRRRPLPLARRPVPALRWCGRSPPESRCCSPSWPPCCSGRRAAAPRHRRPAGAQPHRRDARRQCRGARRPLHQADHRRALGQGRRHLHLDLSRGGRGRHLPGLPRPDTVRRRQPGASPARRVKEPTYTVKVTDGSPVCAVVIAVRAGQSSPPSEPECETAQ